MNQLHPRQDGSGGHVGTRSVTTGQDLLRRARHLANRQRLKAAGVLAHAAARLHGRQLGKMVSRGCRELLRFLRYRLRLTAREAGRPVRFSVNGRPDAPVYPEVSQMTTTSAGLATATYPEWAAAPRAEVVTLGDPWYDEVPRS